MTSRPVRRSLTLAPVVALAALCLSGCGFVADATQSVIQNGEKEFVFDTTAAANSSADSYRFQGFLPDEGKDVRLLTDLATGEGAMRWTSPEPFDIAACDAGAVSGQPAVDPSWWPQDGLPSEGWQCMNWSIVEDDDTFYAWNTTQADVEGLADDGTRWVASFLQGDPPALYTGPESGIAS